MSKRISTLTICIQHPKTTNMPPASFSSCPAEVWIQVYKSLDDAKDATALRGTFRKLRAVWHSNAASISDVIFPRTIKGYNKARELVKIQQKSLGRNHCEDDDRSSQEVLEQNKLMISNAKGYHALHKAMPRPYSPRWLYCDENLRSKIYYCLCMLVLTQGDTSAQPSCFDSLDLETLEIMCDFVGWYSIERFYLFKRDENRPSFPIPFGLEKVVGISLAETLWNVEWISAKRLGVLMIERIGNA